MGLKRNFAKTRSKSKAIKDFIEYRKEVFEDEKIIFYHGFNRGWKDCLKWLKKRGVIKGWLN